MANLRAIVASEDATPGDESPFGDKYEVRGTIVGPTGSGCEARDRLDHLGGGERTEVRNCLSWMNVMRFKELDTVVLDRDVPEHGLRRGDLGAVVQTYEPKVGRSSS